MLLLPAFSAAIVAVALPVSLSQKGWRKLLTEAVDKSVSYRLSVAAKPYTRWLWLGSSTLR